MDVISSHPDCMKILDMQDFWVDGDSLCRLARRWRGLEVAPIIRFSEHTIVWNSKGEYVPIPVVLRRVVNAIALCETMKQDPEFPGVWLNSLDDERPSLLWDSDDSDDSDYTD
jgi:hypothetical protein